jgi:protein gp37
VEPLCMTHGEERPHVRLDRRLPNVWLGVSIENRRYVHRADLLRATPAAVRFISAEPLLGPLTPVGMSAPEAECTWPDGAGWLDLTGIDWLIVGGESGPGHRRMNPEWVRGLRDTCLAKGQRSVTIDPDATAVGDWGPCFVTGGPAFFFKQWGGARPKSNGRLLDGRTWDEMPS